MSLGRLIVAIAVVWGAAFMPLAAADPVSAAPQAAQSESDSVTRAVAVPVPPEPAVPAAPQGVAQVIIKSIYYDGQVSQVESDEYAVIANVGTAPARLAGWRLNADDNGQDFWFPDIELPANSQIRIYTNEYHPESGGFSFGNDQAIWRNKGECGHLYDANGTEVSSWCY